MHRWWGGTRGKITQSVEDNVIKWKAVRMGEIVHVAVSKWTAEGNIGSERRESGDSGER